MLPNLDLLCQHPRRYNSCPASNKLFSRRRWRCRPPPAGAGRTPWDIPEAGHSPPDRTRRWSGSSSQSKRTPDSPAGLCWYCNFPASPTRNLPQRPHLQTTGGPPPRQREPQGQRPAADFPGRRSLLGPAVSPPLRQAAPTGCRQTRSIGIVGREFGSSIFSWNSPFH